MKSILKSSLLASLLVLGSFVGSGMAHASTPTLVANATGSGDMVQLTVTGDPNTNVVFYYQRTGVGLQAQYLGMTSSTGYFSTSISPASYNITAGSPAYVSVNNQQSASVTMPSGSNYQTVSLSQSSVAVAIGQSTSLNIYGGTSPYTMTSSVNNIFQPAIGTSTLTIVGLNGGSGTLTVCSSGSSVGCANLSVTVTGSGTTCLACLALSQSTVTMNVGGTANVTIYPGSNYSTVFYVGGSSNSSVASATISGTSLTLYANAAGTTTMSICQQAGQCASLTVTVSGIVNNPISLSQSTVSLNVGTTTTVTVLGTGPFTLGSNTNPNVATATLNGNVITVHAGNYSSSTSAVIAVCQATNGGTCASLTVLVSGQSTYVTPITFSQNTPTLTYGQTTNITVIGGGPYTIAYNSNPTAVNATISGNLLVLTPTNVQYFAALGGTAIVVCSGSTNCGAIVATFGSSVVSNNWTYCASEGGFCSFAGPQTVRYGANGLYSYRTYANGVVCSNGNFGDPAYLKVKQCSIGGVVGY